jgi:hypothetical protein
VSDWPLFFLGTIAIAVAVIAIVQVAVLVVAAKLAREAAATLNEIRREVRPLVERVTRLSDEASRVTALAAQQVERIDQLMLSATRRVDDTLAVVQGAIIQPVRQGAAVMAAVKAAFSAFRGAQQRARRHRDEEEALFVG